MKNAKEDTMQEVKNIAIDLGRKLDIDAVEEGLSAINSILAISGAIGAVKSVQTGVALTTASQNDIVISPVNPEKCIVKLQSSLVNPKYAPLSQYYTEASSQYMHNMTSYLISLEKEKMTIGRSAVYFYKYVSNAVVAYVASGYVSWQIIEFY